MSTHLRLYTIATLLCTLTFLTTTPFPANAQIPGFLEPFTPWLVESNAKDTKTTGTTKKPRSSRSGEQRFTPALSGPKIPGVAPEDSLALISSLYETQMRPSAIEQFYSKRIIEELQQFGYDLFTSQEPAPTTRTGTTQRQQPQEKKSAPHAAVQDDYILGTGDKVRILQRGQTNSDTLYTIDHRGQIILEDMPPLTVAGMTLGRVQELLNKEAERFYNTEIFVTVENIRQADILILGHVNKPGQQTLTAFNTVLEALIEAGGVKKTGSLRQIKLIRQGRSTYIDLYGLLIYGSDIGDLTLRDGDRIIVPPLGPTVAVAGNVNRPGIYEILPDIGHGRQPLNLATKNATVTRHSPSLNDMLALAGGVREPGANRFLKLEITPDGQETVRTVTAASHVPLFDNGSILSVTRAQEERTGMVELTGHTRYPGLHDLDSNPHLSDLLSSRKVFGPDIYPLLGVIEREDQTQLSRKFIAFQPLKILSGDHQSALEDGDIIHLFSRTQILALQSKDSEALLSHKLSPAKEQGSTPPSVWEIHPAAGEPLMDEPYNLSEDPVLSAFLTERTAFIRGAIRRAGAWPVADGTTLDNLIAVSGGLTLEASTKNIELTRHTVIADNAAHDDEGTPLKRSTYDLSQTPPTRIAIAPGDTVHIKQKFSKVSENSVLLMGEVKNPGRYDLMPGDTLSALLHRAGGLTEQAYPDGAIFSRSSERKAEESRFRAQARELELRLAAALDQDDGPDAAQIAAVQELITQLKQAEAAGRITVEANPGALAANPALDILLQDDDRIYVPKRPLTVRVAGEVLSPATLQFREDKDPRDYIMEGGGFTYHADKDRAFVLYPDGAAQPLQVSAWNHNAIFIPPGSTIIVPRDPKPFDFIETARDVSQILSNLAITGIFVDDIRDD